MTVLMKKMKTSMSYKLFVFGILDTLFDEVSFFHSTIYHILSSTYGHNACKTAIVRLSL